MHGGKNRSGQGDQDGQGKRPHQTPVGSMLALNKLQGVDHGIHHIGRGFSHPCGAETQSRQVSHSQGFRSETPHDKRLGNHGGLATGHTSFPDDACQPYENQQRS